MKLLLFADRITKVPEHSMHTTPHITAYVNYVRPHDRSVAQDCDSKMYNLNPQQETVQAITSCQPIFLCSTGTDLWKLMVLGKMHGHIACAILRS